MAEVAPAEQAEYAEPQVSVVELKVRSPLRAEPFLVQVFSSDFVSAIQDYMMSLGPQQQPITSFDLKFDGQLLDPFITVSDAGLSSETTVDLAPKPYSPRAALIHVQQTRALLGFGHDDDGRSALNVGPVRSYEFEAEINNSKGKKKSKNSKNSQSKQNKGKQQQQQDTPSSDPALVFDCSLQNLETTAFESKVGTARPSKNAPLPAAQMLCLDGWNPVSPQNQLRGHLWYFKFVSIDGASYHITAHLNGFTVNNSSDDIFDASPRSDVPEPESASLIELLQRLCPRTKSEVARVLNSKTKVPAIASAGPWKAFLNVPWAVAARQSTRPDPALVQAGLHTPVGTSISVWSNELSLALMQTPTEAEAEAEGEGAEDETAPRQSYQDRIAREQLILTTCHEFAKSTTVGAREVCQENIEALNPGEPVEARLYVRHNESEFYTYAFDAESFYPDRGGDEAAHISCKRDLRGTEQLLELGVNQIVPVLTNVVDYCGRRVAGQAMVPGAIREDRDDRIAYGFTDEFQQIRADEEFVPLCEKLALDLHLKPHEVEAKDGSTAVLALPDTVRALNGTDGRKYIISLANLTPPDLYFMEKMAPADYPHKLCMMRFEAVNSWFQKQVMAATTEEQQNGTFTRELLDELKHKFRLNPDVYHTEPKNVPASAFEQYKIDRAEVAEASEHVAKVLIPKLITDISQSRTIRPFDGPQLSRLLHDHGINVRYIGYLHQLAKEHDEKNSATGLGYLRAIIETSAVARSCKHLVRAAARAVSFEESLRVISDLVVGLTSLSVSDSLVEQVQKMVSSRFMLQLDATRVKEILSSVEHFHELSSALGLQWNANAVASRFPSPATYSKKAQDITASHIEAIVPVVHSLSYRGTLARNSLDALHPLIQAMEEDAKKEAEPKNADEKDETKSEEASTEKPTEEASEEKAEEAAKATKEETEEQPKTKRVGLSQAGHDILLEVISIYEQIYGVLHPESCNAYRQVSIILLEHGEVAAAARFMRQVAVSCERLYGLDSGEAITAYNNLLYMEQEAGELDAAKDTARHLCALWRSAPRNHPDLRTVLSGVAALMQQGAKHEEALQWIDAAVVMSEKLASDPSSTMTLLERKTQVLVTLRDINAATRAMQKAHNIAKEVFGAESEQAGFAKQWLQELVQVAIPANRLQQQQLQQQRMKQSGGIPKNLAPSAASNNGVDIEELVKLSQKKKTNKKSKGKKRN